VSHSSNFPKLHCVAVLPDCVTQLNVRPSLRSNRPMLPAVNIIKVIINYLQRTKLIIDNAD
jgi:hypothetical protein